MTKLEDIGLMALIITGALLVVMTGHAVGNCFFGNTCRDTPKTAVDIVNYTCTTFDDLTVKCEYDGRG